MRSLAFGISDAANGVFLPGKHENSGSKGTTAVAHGPLHTAAYYNTVNALLATATTRDEALAILGTIRDALLNGGL
jgi:hypothetical protein